MMKTFVNPIIEVKSGKPVRRRAVIASVGTDVDGEPPVDLSLAQYRVLMHCRGPESPDMDMTQSQQGISADSRSHETKP